MEHAYDVLGKCFLLYLLFAAAILMLLIFTMKGAQSNQQGMRAIVIGIVLLAFLIVLVIPCGIDFLGHNIVQNHAIYRNYDNSKGNSGILGMHSVILETGDGETVKLTTVPSFAGDFPVRSFDVVAYYSQRSKLLLYIEVLG